MSEHCEIELSQGQRAKVSFCDFVVVGSYKWTYEARPRPMIGSHATGYAFRLMRPSDGGRRRKTYLHRFVAARMGPIEDGTVIDHVNGDGLDCRRENLRAATPIQNGANNRASGWGQSGYIGVYPRPGGVFEARLVVAGEAIYRERFADAMQAAIFRDRAAREHLGAFAVLNFPDGEPF